MSDHTNRKSIIYIYVMNELPFVVVPFDREKGQARTGNRILYLYAYG